jgi:hypothetical protein
MNNARILAFADFIESLPYSPPSLARVEPQTPEPQGTKLFNMGTFRFETECGTVCCIAGWVPHFFREEFTDGQRLHPSTVDLADALDISYPIASWIAFGGFLADSGGDIRHSDLTEVTPKQAADVLRSLTTMSQDMIDHIEYGYED